LKILIVDDDETKSKAIIDELKPTLGSESEQSVTVVTNLAHAIRVLNLVSFDLIVVDLMLPYLKDGQADSNAGLELLRQLRSTDGPNKATMVICISAFPEEINVFRPNFDELGVLIVKFDDEGTWRRTLLRLLEDVTIRSVLPIEVDFLIVCALEEERRGFEQTALDKLSEAIVAGLNVHYVRLAGKRDLFGGIIRLSQMGLVASTYETTSALNAFRTKILCMSGICAGFEKEVKLGQLVVASPAWEYQAGKWSENKFEIAPVQIPLRPSTRSLVDQAIARESFGAYVEKNLRVGVQRPAFWSNPVLAPFATGSAVIADAQRLKHIDQQHRKVAALDMETFGLYFAAHERSDAIKHFFSVKCVVDTADGKKGDDLHTYGCIAAARATEALILELAD
jgi:adenosylhomocysteine nucleosidase